jgi:glyoxylase-like metal-dependent hydrolase (beta-lactamase superfamily II)/rhodanese-related sulfurtransferase
MSENTKEWKDVGTLTITQFSHPQGCRGYLLEDKETKTAMTIDIHLDYINQVTEKIKQNNLELKYIVDTHTHADHPSGAGTLHKLFSSATRVAHEKAEHVGVTLNPKDGDILEIGNSKITVKHAPGHTPDHMVLATDKAVFTGDTLFIGAVARTDFLGGDAGQLFDSLQKLLKECPDETIVFPGHDYNGQTDSTIGKEKEQNPWLKIDNRAKFIESLTANPPPRPANMDALLQLNREGVNIPEKISVETAIERIKNGGASSIIDVRTAMELAAEHVEGVRHIPLDRFSELADKVRATPAPRMLMCQSGNRATTAFKQLSEMGIGGLSVVEGGMNAYKAANGQYVKGKSAISLERQVRIVAGFIVLTGALLGYFLNPAFVFISAFVGAGLIFAGITDTCGMAMLLTQMPWNRTQDFSADGAGGGGCCAASPQGTCSASAPEGGCSAEPPK